MDTKPYSAPHKDYVMYAVGQPMGAKTSWAAFTLAHHAVVRLICRYHRVPEEYRIIGDDIVIANEKVANSYMSLLNSLGVPHSKDKSVFPYGNMDSCQEFAKRLFRAGVELSPITPNLTNRVWADRIYPVFLSVMDEIERKWDSGYEVNKTDLMLRPLTAQLFHSLPKEWRRKVVNAICGPRYLAALERGVSADSLGTVRVENPFAGVDDLTFYQSLGTVVTARLQHYVDLLTEINSRHNVGGVLPRSEENLTLLHLTGPYKFAAKRLEQTVKTVYQAIANGDLNLQIVMDLGLDLTYLKELSSSQRPWSAHKRLLDRRNQSTMKFYDDLLKAIKEPSSYEDEWYSAKSMHNSVQGG